MYNYRKLKGAVSNADVIARNAVPRQSVLLTWHYLTKIRYNNTIYKIKQITTPTFGLPVMTLWTFVTARN